MRNDRSGPGWWIGASAIALALMACGGREPGRSSATDGPSASSPRAGGPGSAAGLPETRRDSRQPDAGQAAPSPDAGAVLERCRAEWRGSLTGALRVPADFATIQSAVDAASSGDVILIARGVYVEPVVVAGKAVTLASEYLETGDPTAIDETIVDGDGETVITVETPDRETTTVIGLTIRNGDDGIRPTGGVNILCNRITGATDGIDYEGGGGLCLGNRFDANRDDAIDLDGPTAATIEANRILNSRDDGIEIRLHPYSGERLHVVIRNNVISGNRRDGIQIIDYPGDSDRTFRIERNLFLDNGKAGIGFMPDERTDEDYSAGQPLEPAHVVHNTFVRNEVGISGGGNVAAANNIIVGASVAGVLGLGPGSTLVRQLFWGNSADEQRSRAGTRDLMRADPRLSADYGLGAGSPAIDAGIARFDWAGLTVLDLRETDYRGSAPDLGWRETP